MVHKSTTTVNGQKKLYLSCPPLRFPDFNDDWTQTTLGATAEKKRKKNNDNAISKVYSNSAQLGIIEQTDFFDKEIANSNNLRGYYIVEYLDFIYNPRISSWAPVGAMNLNKQTELGIVSPLYTVFRIDQRMLNPYFVGYLFKSNVWHTYMKQIANYGARDDRMNIKDSDFFALPISLPTLAEQKKIADFLSLIDERIQSSIETIKELKTQKAGLLNQLFSQKLRFPDFDDEWTQTTLGEIAEITSGYSGEQEQIETPYRVSRIETISSGVIDIDRVGFVPYDARLEEYKLSLGDILFSNINSIEHIGKSAIVRKPVDLYHGMNLLRLKAINIDPYSLYYHLQRDVVRNRFRSIANKAVSQASINQTTLGKEVILFAPSLSEQKKIADFLSLIDERIEVEEQLLQQYEKQKRYLLRQMFV